MLYYSSKCVVILVLAIIAISSNAMNNVGNQEEKEALALYAPQSNTMKTNQVQQEKAYDEKLLKKISTVSFLKRLLDESTDVNEKQNMMRDVNKLEDTIESSLESFQCPQNPTVLDGIQGKPKCDGDDVCKIAKESLKDMTITKDECEKLRNALISPHNLRFQKIKGGMRTNNKMIPLPFFDAASVVISMLSRAIIRRIPEIATNMAQQQTAQPSEQKQLQEQVFDPDRVSVYLLDYDGCSDTASPLKTMFVDEQNEMFQRYKDDIRRLRSEFFLNLEALRGNSRVIAFCASARQGKSLDYFNAENNQNGYALGSAKFTKHEPSAFELMSERYEWTLNKATMSDFRNAEHFTSCIRDWNDESCHVDGEKWDDQYQEGDNDWYSAGDDWGHSQIEFDRRIKISTAENTLRALGRMKPESGGLTAEEKRKGVNVFFFDDRAELLRAVRRYTKLPDDLDFEVHFFTLHFDINKYLSRGSGEASKLKRFVDSKAYNIEHLRTEAVRERAVERMKKQTKVLKRTQKVYDMQEALLQSNEN